MNIKIIVIAIVAFSGMQIMAQTKNHMIIDNKTKTNMLVGYCDKNGLEKDAYGVHFLDEYDSYKPKDRYINKLNDKLDNIEMTIVLGTWCSDSKREVPRYYKILNEVGYDDKRIRLIAVDRNKEATGIDIMEIDIQKVPTFIIYRDKIEIGRIIETPNKSLESDLWKIVK